MSATATPQSTHQKQIEQDAAQALVTAVHMRSAINALRHQNPNRNAAFDAALDDAENALQRLAKFL